MNPNRLSPRQREAVAQTIAAEALEGWQPTDENTSDLVDLALDRLTFNNYLAKYLVRAWESNGPVRRKVIARRRPYLIPGTGVLRNNFGLDNPAVLAELEFLCTAGRLVRLHLQPAHPDARALHRAIFADVYSWAGELRITDLRRGQSSFAPVDSLHHRLAQIHSDAQELAETKRSDTQFAYRLAHIYSAYNHTHPFREGNGRTGSLLLHKIADRSGRRVDLGRVTRTTWIEASRDCLPFRRDGVADHRPFLPIMNTVLAGAAW